MPGLLRVKQDREPAALSAVSGQILFLTVVSLSFTQLSVKLRTLKRCFPAAACCPVVGTAAQVLSCLTQSQAGDTNVIGFLLLGSA